MPDIDASSSYPKRSNEDAALLEWGSSAIIHNADGVVARFGPSASDPEFELGIEAELVTANKRQGCEPLSNAAEVATQIVVMTRGTCDFGVKAENAARAGAAALIVVNSDRRSPDRTFAMSYRAKGEVSFEEERRRSQAADDDDTMDPLLRDAVARLPCVMISYAAGQQLREVARPRRMRLFAGGGRPFIESVTDVSPVLYLVHNAATEDEIKSAKNSLSSFVFPKKNEGTNTFTVTSHVDRANRVLGCLKGRDLSSFYERVASIVGYPVEHLSDLALEVRQPDGMKRKTLGPIHDYQRLSRFNAETGDDSRAQTIMTVFVFLDDLEDEEDDKNDGGLYFLGAKPSAVRIKPLKGLAAVWYSALEDGSLDRSAAHADGPLFDKSISVLQLRVYANPRPFARRVLLPLFLLPFKGRPPKSLVLASKRFFARSFGEGSAATEFAIDLSLYAIAALLLAPLIILGLAIVNALEQSRAKPKRTKATDLAKKTKVIIISK